MAKTTVMLMRFFSPLVGAELPNEGALSYLHGKKITVQQVPRPGDLIKDSETGSGYVEVAKVIFDLKGNITLAIK